MSCVTHVNRRYVRSCGLPTGGWPRMADIAGAVAFLLRNPAVNGVSLNVDGGTLLG